MNDLFIFGYTSLLVC